jgi:hypothetical protein
MHRLIKHRDNYRYCDRSYMRDKDTGLYTRYSLEFSTVYQWSRLNHKHPGEISRNMATDHLVFDVNLTTRTHES